MRYSRLFGKTLREVPKEIRSEGHRLLLRAGYVRSLGQGLNSLLPLGKQVFSRIIDLIKEEMDQLGGQEVEVPLVNPRDIWIQSGREALVDQEMIRFEDRTGRELVLSPTHEEAMVELVRLGMNSYRDLPVMIYEFQTRFRDEERTRCGLIRAKEFMMKDAYSFHRSYSDLNNFFPRVHAAYKRIFKALELDVFTAEAGVGYIGGSRAYEFLVPAGCGDDVVITCESCGYTANREVAVGGKQETSENPLPMEPRETPDCNTMDSLAGCLDLPKSRLAKCMVYRTVEGMVMAVVRGDYEVSVEKLTQVLHIPVIGFAEADELKEIGLIPGYLSPLGMEDLLPIVVDETVASSSNLVYGGNKWGVHYINVNFGRDYESRIVADISLVGENDTCLHCGGPLKGVRAVELGNIFKLDDVYSRALELSVQDDDGKQIYPHMGAYGIGIGRLMAAIAEVNHDERGLLWPRKISPYVFYLMSIGKSLTIKRLTAKIADYLGDDCLFDDREESPGVKFKDADLIGIPYRIVVSSRHVNEQGVEFRERRSGEQWYVDVDDVFDELDRIRKDHT